MCLNLAAFLPYMCRQERESGKVVVKSEMDERERGEKSCLFCFSFGSKKMVEFGVVFENLVHILG